MLAAINYHYIREQFDFKYPGIHGISPKHFENQLKSLLNYTNFIDQSYLCDRISENIKLKNNVSLVTFDDGLKEQFVHALPVLDALKVPAVFFINTRTLHEKIVLGVHKIHILRSRVAPDVFSFYLKEFIAAEGLDIDFEQALVKGESHYKYDKGEAARIKYILNFSFEAHEQSKFIDLLFEIKIEETEEEISANLYMNEKEVKVLGEKGFVGSHTHDHNPVGLLKDEEKSFQVNKSKTILEDITGVPVVGLSYPYGSKDSANGVASHLKEAGYVYALTMERALNSNLENPFFLSRFDNNDMPLGKAYEFKTNDFFKHYPKSTWWN